MSALLRDRMTFSSSVRLLLFRQTLSSVKTCWETNSGMTYLLPPGQRTALLGGDELGFVSVWMCKYEKHGGCFNGSHCSASPGTSTPEGREAQPDGQTSGLRSVRLWLGSGCGTVDHSLILKEMLWSAVVMKCKVLDLKLHQFSIPYRWLVDLEAV